MAKQPEPTNDVVVQTDYYSGLVFSGSDAATFLSLLPRATPVLKRNGMWIIDEEAASELCPHVVVLRGCIRDQKAQKDRWADIARCVNLCEKHKDLLIAAEGILDLPTPTL